jgi:hypothetical protein
MPTQQFALLRQGTMNSQPEIVALRESYASFAKAKTRDRASARQIQPLVCDAVDAMKADGWPPERVIVAIKALAREVGLVPEPILPVVQETTPGDSLLADSVKWCIEHYYKGE